MLFSQISLFILPVIRLGIMVGRDISLMILFEDGPRAHQTNSAYFPSVTKHVYSEVV
jgi:hypothetical protein